MANVDGIKSLIGEAGGPALGCQYVFNIIPPMAFLGITEGLEQGLNGDIFGGIATAAQDLFKTGFLKNKAGHVSMLAESVSIPGRQLLSTEHRIFGTVRKMPYGVLYEDLTATFICTNSMIERTFFDVWQQLIISPGSQYMEFYENYVGSVVIQKVSNLGTVENKSQKDNKNQDPPPYKKFEKLATYVLQEAYPISIQSQELSYSDGDYLKLTVQFAYSKWKSVLDFSMPNNPKLTPFG